VVIYCFWRKSEIFLSAKPEVELILTIAPIENIFNVKYLENGEKYDVGLEGDQISIGTISLTLDRPSSKSLQLQSNISITLYVMQQHWADARSIERISCS